MHSPRKEALCLINKCSKIYCYVSVPRRSAALTRNTGCLWEVKWGNWRTRKQQAEESYSVHLSTLNGYFSTSVYDLELGRSLTITLPYIYIILCSFKNPLISMLPIETLWVAWVCIISSILPMGELKLKSFRDFLWVNIWGQATMPASKH